MLCAAPVEQGLGTGAQYGGPPGMASAVFAMRIWEVVGRSDRPGNEPAILVDGVVTIRAENHAVVNCPKKGIRNRIRVAALIGNHVVGVVLFRHQRRATMGATVPLAQKCGIANTRAEAERPFHLAFRG